MSKKRKIALLAIGSLSILILFLGAILPGLLRTKAAEAIREATGRTAHIAKVSINPFTLAVSVQGLVIEERGGGPFISIGQLHVSLSLSSLYKRALVLSRVAIASPALSIVRAGPGQYSFTDILERKQGEKKPPPAPGLFPISIYNISVTNGSLDFIDQAVAGGRKHAIRHLEIAVPFISTIPSLAEEDIHPRLSAVVNGASFNLGGRGKPFGKSQESVLHVVLQQLQLPELMAYAPQDPPPVDLQSGKLTLDTEVSYRVAADKKPDLTIKGLARLEDVNVTMKQGQPLVKLPALEIQAARLEIFTPLFEIGTVTLEGPELFISRNQRGEWMYDRLLKAKAGRPLAPMPGKEPALTGQAARPVYTVGSLALKNGKVHFHDALPPGGFRASASEIDLELKNLTNRPEQFAEYGLSLRLDKEAAFSSAGSFSLASPEAQASIKLAGLKLQKGWPYLAQFLTAPVRGNLGFSGDLSFSEQDGLTAEKGNLTLQNLAVSYGENEGLKLALLAVNGVTFSQKKNSLAVAGLRLSQGDISLSREADGKISLQSLLRPSVPDQGQPAAGASASLSPPEAGPAAARGIKPFTYHIKRLQLDKFHAAFTDKSRPGKPRFTLRDTALSLVDLKGPEFTPAQFHFLATFGGETPLKASGDITPLPFRYHGEISVGAMPIRDFEDYFPDNLNVAILNGRLDTALKLDIAMKDGAPTGSFQGNAGISAFHAIDAEEEEDLLKWERLQLDDVQGDLRPFSLAIGEIAINRVYSRIIVRKDGTLNLQHLVRNEEESGSKEPSAEDPSSKTETASPAPVTPAAVPSPPGDTETVRTSIGAVTVLDGTISFTDYHLPQHYATTFYNLGGRISGLSSAASTLADVDLRGNMENHSPLRITGRVNPLRDDLFVDLKVSFNDIELSPLTPYAGTYLGYTVEKGKLFLDLTYHIEKKILNSENRILIDQFTFGNKVESDQATSLPVNLGLALLKDRKGEINLDVPVTGRTDDPEFSIWRLVFQVLKNLLVKAATSPLALFSSIFGGDSDLSTIVFASGTAVLPAPEEQKLSALARGLNDRPALKMELTAYVDPEKDPEGYRVELLNRKLRNEKFLALAKGGQSGAGESAETMNILPDEYSPYLKAVYAKEKFPKPRNDLGLVLDLPDSEMSKLIIANTVIGEGELQTLARERSRAVLDYLIQKGSVESGRIFQKNDDIFKLPVQDKTARSRVEVNALAQ